MVRFPAPPRSPSVSVDFGQAVSPCRGGGEDRFSVPEPVDGKKQAACFPHIHSFGKSSKGLPWAAGEMGEDKALRVPALPSGSLPSSAASKRADTTGRTGTSSSRRRQSR